METFLGAGEAEVVTVAAFAPICHTPDFDPLGVWNIEGTIVALNA